MMRTGEFSTHLVSLSRTLLNARAAAQEPGGLISGVDPTKFNTSDPIRMWIIQVGLIMITTQLLSLVLRKLRQPRVIAEIIGGILLGPTAFGDIPGFTEHIFPSESLPYLSLTANIGLCLFLFLIGLEIETTVIKRNMKASAAIALAGISIPFGLGTALAVPIYNQFISSDVKYTNFMLFTAFSITAFPVLARILTELKLLDTTVGVVVLSAGVGNDVIGWVLLALAVALANSGAGVTAVYILLSCLAWTFTVLFPCRWFFDWLARKTGSTENGPTIFYMSCAILFMFGSAFFTDIIGVHAIFGAFLAGLVVPRKGGLPIKITEKLEDMVSIIFLPLYFTTSGLSTNLRLLNSALIWGYVVAICAVAFAGKFGGCMSAARFIGFGWRESLTIGSLMSCKGLIELIVLNIGLSAGILTERVFSMFVLEAVTLTCLTTPLISVLYPPEKRVRINATGIFSHVADGTPGRDAEARSSLEEGLWKRRFTFVLDKLEHLPGMMAVAQMLPTPPDITSPRSSSEGSTEKVNGTRHLSLTINTKRHISSHARPTALLDTLRVVELTRKSEVMKASIADSLVHTDPVLNVFRMFGELHGLPVAPTLSIVPFEDMAPTVVEHADAIRSHLIVLPWLPPYSDPNREPASARDNSAPSPGPFDTLFRTTTADHSASVQHSHFVRSVFAQALTDVALYVDCAHPGPVGARVRQHLFLPFFGGPDDRLALDFVVQLCGNPSIRATVIRVFKREMQSDGPAQPEGVLVSGEGDQLHLPAGVRIPGDHSVIHTQTAASTMFPDTVYGHANTQTRLMSETADSVAWARYTAPDARDEADPALADALSRVEFHELATPIPLHAVVNHAAAAAEPGTSVLAVVGRARRMAVEDHSEELKEMGGRDRIGSEVRKTIGDVATAFVLEGSQTGLLVMQAVVAAA